MKELLNEPIIHALLKNSQTFPKVLVEKREPHSCKFDPEIYHLKKNHLSKNVLFQKVGQIVETYNSWLRKILAASRPAQKLFDELTYSIDLTTNICKSTIDSLTESQLRVRQRAIKELIELGIIKKCGNKNIMISPYIIVPTTDHSESVIAHWNSL